MPAGVAPRVQETTTTSGTGPVTLLGASTGYQAFVTPFGTSATTDIFSYEIQDGAAWEIGTGHLTGTGPWVLNRDHVESSTNGGAAISLSGSSAKVFCPYTGPRVESFASSATWTKRPGAKAHLVIAVGQGGGAGSGRQGAAASVRQGGSGGQAGGISSWYFDSNALTSTVSVTVNGSGGGGAAQATPSTNGNPGTAGADSLFGNFLAARGGAAGLGGTAVAVAGGTGAGAGVNGTGGAGGAVAVTTAVGAVGVQGTLMAAGGGGGGSGLTAANAGAAAGAGGAGAPLHGSVLTGGTAATSTLAAGQGTQAQTGEGVGGPGGGGGSSLGTTATQWNGAKGGNYGGGGGGGAGTLNGSSSGAGGQGGDGIVIVITWF